MEAKMEAKMEVKEKQFVRTTIDLPAALNEKLLREAEKTKRSRHAQMLVALENFFETAPGGGGKKETKR